MRNPRVNITTMKELRMLVARGEMTNRQGRLAKAELTLVRTALRCPVAVMANAEGSEHRR